jgi:hypothetical protein
MHPLAFPISCKELVSAPKKELVVWKNKKGKRKELVSTEPMTRNVNPYMLMV